MKSVNHRFFSLLILSFLVSSPYALSDSNQLDKQRQQYRQAMQYFEEEKLDQFTEILPSLSSYPLYPWLQYLSLSTTLGQLPYTAVDEFLDTQANTVVAERLLSRWLEVLGEKKRWHDYRSYYSNIIQSPKLQCLNLWARFKTGDKSALEEVPQLWDSSLSRPNECDLIFKEWIDRGLVNNEILWSRYKKAVASRNPSLIRYLTSLANTGDQAWYRLHKKTIDKPSLLSNKDQYPSNQFNKDTVKQALLSLQLIDYQLANDLFSYYQKQYDFDTSYRENFIGRQHRITLSEVGFEEFIKTAKNENFSQRTLGNILNAAVAEKNWQQYLSWFEKLDEDEKNREQWQYWRAWALEKTDPKNQQKANLIFSQLAGERSYYGFLSAEKTFQAYKFNNRSVVTDQDVISGLQLKPELKRARELYFHKSFRAARQEWNQALKEIPETDYSSLAYLTHTWGWHRKSIELLSSIQAWDDMQLRFPLAHMASIQGVAKTNQVAPSLVFAIARQESAWQEDALSHANARGLMQMIPSTARATARAAGISFELSHLFEAEKNLTLGSFHIRELLDLYGNNRIPAIAAYNAGKHRVKSWLEESDKSLPVSIWIESIPFPETRKYVKNVLFYSAIYDYQQGVNVTFFTQDELREKL